MAQTARRPGLLGAALVFATAAAVVYAVFVWTRTGQSLDAELLHRAPQGGEYEQVTALAAPAKTVLTFFGDKMTLLALVAAILLAGTASSRARAGVAGVLVPLFGRHRERAEGCARAARLRRHGVDHAQQLSERSRRRRSRPAAGDAGRGTVADALVGCRAGVSVVAAATMAADWHRLSDVVVAVLIASALCCLAAAVLQPAGTPQLDSGGASWLAGGLVVVPLTLAPVLYAGTTAPGPASLLVAMAVAGGVVAAAVLAVVPLLRYAEGWAGSLAATRP